MAKKASTGGTRIVPLNDRVVLKRAEAEEVTAGGIVLPDAAQSKPQQGEVIAVGDGHFNDKGEKVALTVKEGDKVILVRMPVMKSQLATTNTCCFAKATSWRLCKVV